MHLISFVLIFIILLSMLFFYDNHGLTMLFNAILLYINSYFIYFLISILILIFKKIFKFIFLNSIKSNI